MYNEITNLIEACSVFESLNKVQNLIYWASATKTRLEKSPKIVCLCGSTRFKEAFEKANKEETLKGNIVLSVGCFGHLEGIDMEGEVKKNLDKLHLQKIDLADEVLFLNVGGYIGSSTSKELGFARFLGKEIRFLEPEKKYGASSPFNCTTLPLTT